MLIIVLINFTYGPKATTTGDNNWIHLGNRTLLYRLQRQHLPNLDIKQPDYFSYGSPMLSKLYQQVKYGRKFTEYFNTYKSLHQGNDTESLRYFFIPFFYSGRNVGKRSLLYFFKWDTDKKITLYTQLSVDRLDRLKRIAHTWDGPISATLFVESIGDLKLLGIKSTNFRHLSSETIKARALIDQILSSNPNIAIHLMFHRLFFVRYVNVKGSDGNKAFNMPYSHVPRSSKIPYDDAYPINSLRNLALMMAESDLVFYLDVDFVPSRGLYQSLLDHYDWIGNEMSRTYNAHLIVPAFDYLGKAKDSSLVIPKFFPSLDDAKDLCTRSLIIPFHSTPFRDWRANRKRGGLTDSQYFDYFCSGDDLVWNGSKSRSFRHFRFTDTHISTNFQTWFHLNFGKSSTGINFAYFINHLNDTRKLDAFGERIKRVSLQNEKIPKKMTILPRMNRVNCADNGRLTLDRYFEPYIVSHKQSTILWSDYFRHYGFNKRSSATRWQMMGGTFFVFLKGFVIHYPHISQSELRRKQSFVDHATLKKIEFVNDYFSRIAYAAYMRDISMIFINGRNCAVIQNENEFESPISPKDILFAFENQQKKSWKILRKQYL